jgi:hypothetical protein
MSVENRSAKAERDMFTACANASAVHCRATCVCISASALPIAGSRNPASQPVASSGNIAT